jgi:two-component system, OmpR family, catabolic regulation response regulator CreB
MPQKILVVEDERSIADTIVFALKSDGFDPVWRSTGAEAKAVVERETVSLVVLDVGLPDVNGFDLCREIRRTSQLPILFLTARSGEIDRVVGLELGADDYMVKPFSPRELVARVKAILRRTVSMPAVDSNRSAPHAAVANDKQPFFIDEQRMTISFYGVHLDLSKYEFRILQTLIGHPGRVFSREALISHSCDEPGFSMERSVDAHIKNIRAKLREVKPDLDPIETRRGFGYLLRESPR